MNKKNSSLVAVVWLLMLAAVTISPADAQTVPALINYQGKLVNSNGLLVSTGDYPLRFRIYDAVTNGNLIWGPQVFNGQTGPGYGPLVSVVQGWFNVILGPSDTNAVPIANAFNGPNRFMEIQLSTNAPFSPRLQVLSAPYALFAGKSDTAQSALSASIANDAGHASLSDFAVQASNATLIAGIGVNTSPAPNKLLPLDAAGKFPTSTVSLKKYDSGWFAVSEVANVSKIHALGTTAVLTSVYFGNTSDGSGIVCDTHGTAWRDHNPQQTSGVTIVALTPQSITLQLGADLRIPSASPGVDNSQIVHSGYARIVMLALE